MGEVAPRPSRTDGLRAFRGIRSGQVPALGALASPHYMPPSFLAANWHSPSPPSRGPPRRTATSLDPTGACVGGDDGTRAARYRWV